MDIEKLLYSINDRLINHKFDINQHFNYLDDKLTHVMFEKNALTKQSTILK